jgi:hypothetical protein
MKRYIVKSKVRFLVSLSLIILFTVSSLFTLVVSAKGSDEVVLVSEYVEPGDTIWELSQAYNGDMDIREYISIVMDVNNLQSASIKPGELLYFPMYNR